MTGCLLCLLIAAMWTDFRKKKVSNRLVCFGLFLGYIRNLSVYGWNGSIYFLVQISIPVLMFYLLFLMHAFGAGDIKLFSVVSSCIGIKGFFQVMIHSFLVGAVFSFAVLIRNRNLFSRVAYFFHYAKTALSTKTITQYDYESDGKQNIIHFSVAIFIGFLMYLGGM